MIDNGPLSAYYLKVDAGVPFFVTVEALKAGQVAEQNPDTSGIYQEGVKTVHHRHWPAVSVNKDPRSGRDGFIVSWQPVSGAEGYEVYWSEIGSNGNPKIIKNPPKIVRSPATSVRIGQQDGIVIGKKYEVAVIAFGSGKNHSPLGSNSVIGVDVEGDLRVEAFRLLDTNTTKSIDVIWPVEDDKGITGYTVQWAEVGQPFNTGQQVGPNAGKYRITGLKANSIYDIKVTQVGGVYATNYGEVRMQTGSSAGQTASNLGRPNCGSTSLHGFGDGVTGRLTDNGCQSRLRDRPGANAVHYTFQVPGSGKKTVIITAKSSDFDAYIYLLAGGNLGTAYEIDEADDIAVRQGDFNARLIKDLNPGTYTIEVTSFFANETGEFTLRLEEYSRRWTAPPIEPRPGFVPTSLVGGYTPAPLIDNLAIDTNGRVSWGIPSSDQGVSTYQLRWTYGGYRLSSAAGQSWFEPENLIAVGECASAVCRVSLPDFDNSQHYLVQVRPRYEWGERGSWVSARHTPVTPPPDDGGTDPEPPALNAALPINVVISDGQITWQMGSPTEPNRKYFIRYISGDGPPERRGGGIAAYSESRLCDSAGYCSFRPRVWQPNKHWLIGIQARHQGEFPNDDDWVWVRHTPSGNTAYIETGRRPINSDTAPPVISVSQSGDTISAASDESGVTGWKFYRSDDNPNCSNGWAGWSDVSAFRDGRRVINLTNADIGKWVCFRANDAAGNYGYGKLQIRAVDEAPEPVPNAAPPVSVAISSAGRITWQMGSPAEANRKYFIRYVSGDGPPAQHLRGGIAAYSESRLCDSAGDCGFQISTWNSGKHWLVGVQTRHQGEFPNSGDWVWARYAP